MFISPRFSFILFLTEGGGFNFQMRFKSFFLKPMFGIIKCDILFLLNVQNSGILEISLFQKNELSTKKTIFEQIFLKQNKKYINF